MKEYKNCTCIFLFHFWNANFTFKQLNNEYFLLFFLVSGIENICFRYRSQAVHASNLAAPDLGQLDQKSKVLGAVLHGR